jgi:ABC-type sulfate transport system permease component
LASNAAVIERRTGAASGRAGGALAKGVATGYLSLVVLLPLAALIWSSRADGGHSFWHQATRPEAISALKLTLGVAAVCALINAVTGTAIAWVLVRDRFPGKGAVDARAPDQRRERQEDDQAEVTGRDSLRERSTGAA